MSDTVELLLAIANRPEASWRALVAERFAGDATLAAQALVWLHANAERVDDDETKPVLAGDRYELGVLLDVGATASVWQAHDRKLGRNVAIKLFRGERSPVLDEILAEARAACEVQSDHVVRVLDVHDTDPPYIVMELVGEYEPKRGVLAPGSSAATLRPRTIDEAMRWVRDVARGVHDAHLRNVFHRDLKPHNVLITPFSRRARIADFGLAVSDAHDRTGPLQIAGTPGYIAPEQASGLPAHLDPHDLDERAVLVALDVWGLGALAYDLLADRAPWQALAGHEAWELAASATESPTLPRSIPRRLRRIVDKALAIDPKARYATAAELADDVDAYLTREPTSHDVTRVSRFVLWCRRNPQLTMTVGLATVLAAISVVAYVNVVEVRAQRNALVVEAAAATADNEELERRAHDTKRELMTTETELHGKAKALDELRATLTEAEKEYQAIVAAKERALRDADAATRQLADELSNARSERDEARLGREMYEGFWTRARADGDEAAHDRDQAQHDRDAARKERDQAIQERDTATAARTHSEQERDRALADRDRAEAIRRRVEADLTRLAAELAGLKLGPTDAGVPHVAVDATHAAMATYSGSDPVLTPSKSGVDR